MNAMKTNGALRRTVVTTLALCVATTGLVACSDDASSPEAASESSTRPVQADPNAPELTESGSTYNFVRSNKDGTTGVLATVKVRENGSWVGLADEQGQFTVLDKGTYDVVARGASGCSGVGSEAAKGLGVIGKVIVEDENKADVWSTPAEVDSDSLTTLALVDSDNVLKACAKTVNWTEPTSTAS